MNVDAGTEARGGAEALFREVSPTLWRTMYAFTGGRRDLADDAVAEAFARALAHWGEIRDPTRWIYRVAFRVAAYEMKRESRASPSIADPTSDAPAELHDLVRALRRLSPNQCAAVGLRYEADQPVGEIAKRMGTSEAAVRVHLYRGRRRLRELLEEEMDTDG